MILGQGIEVDRIRERSFLLGAKEVLLTEVAKLLRGVLFVEPDEVLEAADRWIPALGQVGIEVMLELIEEDLQLPRLFQHRLGGGDVGRIDDLGAELDA